MKNNKQIFTEISERTDIVEVISEYINVRKAGANYKAICPFHNDTNPSLMISPSKQIYKCFVCGAGGGSINFVKDFLGISSLEAAKTIAEKFGINVEFSNRDEAKETKLTFYYKIYEIATEFYHKLLFTDVGRKAYNYLLNRGFDDETIKTFKLGYSPGNWNELYSELKRLNFTDTQILESKIALSKNDKINDFFYRRIMFPIRDYIGRTIAFGARKLDEEDKDAPKYVNSVDSPIYNKSRVLYGFFECKREILTNRTAILVEGYADLISLYKFGFLNAVAPCGTSLTQEQANIIKRSAEKIFLLYDGDSAGVKATLRSLEICVSAGLDSRIVSLPEGEDPDDFVRTRGSASLHQLIDKSENFIEFICRVNKDKLREPAGKAEVARKLIEIIITMPDKFLHDEFIQLGASYLRLSYRQIEQLYKEKDELEKKIKPKSEQNYIEQNTNIKKREIKNIEMKSVMINQYVHLIPKEAAENMLPAELNLLNVILVSDNPLLAIENQYDIHHSYFPSVYGQNAFSLIYETAFSHKNVVEALVSDDSADFYRDLILNIAIPSEEIKASWERFDNELDEINYDKVVRDSVNFLIRKKLNEELKKVSAKLKLTSDENTILSLMSKIPGIKNKLKKDDLFEYKDILLEEDESGL